MTYMTTTNVPTASGSKYFQQLCKHWSHNLAVEFDETHGRVVFPKDARGAEWPGDAIVTFDVSPDALAITIEASADGQRQGLKGAVERHLDRFAFREAPLAYDWQDA